MPIRMLRDGILTSQRVDLLSPVAEVFYRRLMSVVDDYGRTNAHPKLLRAACYPLRIDSITDEEMCGWLSECLNAELLTMYEFDGKQYLELWNFGEPRAKTSRYPDPTKGCKILKADARKCFQTRANVPPSPSPSPSPSVAPALAPPDSAPPSASAQTRDTGAIVTKKREPNPYWDAVVAIWFPEGVQGQTQQRRVGKLAREFKELNATEAEIRLRKGRMEKAWPNIPKVTADAVLKHWGEFSTVAAPAGGWTAAEQDAYCGVTS